MNSIEIFYKENNVVEKIGQFISEINYEELVIVCIGSDKLIFDSLGPFIGTNLSKNNLNNIYIYGTLNNPINALNIERQVLKIKRKHPNSIILAIDACLGKTKDIGKIKIAKEPIHPGRGLKIYLPPVGDYSIKAITANSHTDIVRLNLISELSDVICNSILKYLKR